MATLKIDSILADFIKKVINGGHLQDQKTISEIVENAILFFLQKHPNCLSCDFHRDMIIGLEVGRQKRALDKLGQQFVEDKGHWVLVKRQILDACKNFSRHYRRASKATMEQAILESLTRPSQCKTCPFFAEMKEKTKSFSEELNGNHSSTETSVCTPSSSHGAQPNGCSSQCEETGSIRQRIGLQNPDSNRSRDGQ